MKRYLRCLPLLVLALFLVVACSSHDPNGPWESERTSTSSQALTPDAVPTVTCSSNPNVFNTGYNAATNGVLANNALDANWTVGGPTNSPNGLIGSSLPVGVTFAAANVGNLVPAAWNPPTSTSAQWISQQTIASPVSVEGDWYYEYNFNLDASVTASTFSLSMTMMSDNEISAIFVNGVNQAVTGLPQDPTSSIASEYNYVGYTTANETSVTLNKNWATGSNTIIVQVKSGPPEQGFAAWAKPQAFCSSQLSVTKTASPAPYVAGSQLTYTITVTNSGASSGTVDQATMSDTLPAALALGGFTWTCAATTGSFCAASGTGNITDTPVIAGNGGTVTYTLKGTVPALTTGAISNTVTVTPPSGDTDTGCTPNCSATNIDTPADSMTLTSSPSTTVYGQSTTLTATLSPLVGPAGTVTFVDTVSNTQIGSPVTVIAGVASATVSTLEVGSDPITATYTSSNGWPSATGSTTQTVNKDSTTTSLASSASPAGVGSAVTFTANVGVSLPGAGTPTGTVTFYDGATSLGTGTVTAGQATFTTSSLSVGIHSITAAYGGDADDQASTSAIFVETISVVAPSIVVTSSSAGSTSSYGTPVTITATIGAAADGGPGPTGTVTFAYPGGTQTVTLTNGVASITLSSLPAGVDLVTATYSGDGNYLGVTGSVTQTVTSATTATTLTSGANPAVYGQSVPLTATVNGTAGGATPSGTVSFFEGGGPGDDGGVAILLGTVALDGSAQATLTTSALVPGAYAIYAVYSGDLNYGMSTSSPLTETVNEAATTTALASSSNPTGDGATVTFTATVAPVTPGAGTPTGTVTFYDGAAVIGTGTLVLGVATYSTSTLSQGTHSITAAYGGDTDFSASTSSVVSEVISANAATVAIVTSGTPSGYGQAVTFTATVTSSNGIPTGTVTFTDGSTPLGTGTLNALGVTTYTTSTLSTGTHTITATYGGDATHSGGGNASLSQVVNASSSSTSLQASPLAPVYGQPVTLTATVTSPSVGSASPTGTVQLYDGATLIGSGTVSASGTVTITVTSLPVGVDSITATYGGDTNYGTSTSLPVVVTVTQAATTTALTSSSNPSVVNTSVTFTATILPTAPGAGTPTGTVLFNDGISVLGTGTLSGGVATFSTSSLVVGTHPITAVYSGDIDFAVSTSAILSQVVSAAGATETLTASPSPGTYGNTETLTATLTGAPTPTGTVTFANGSTTLGTGTLASGTASITTKTLPVGTLTLTATYGGDATYPPTTATTSLTIDQAATTTTLKSSANPSASGESVTFTATVASSVTGFTGTVKFLDGATELGTETLSGSGTAALSTAALSVGTHAITAVYSGDTDFATSTSAVLSQVVGGSGVADGGAGDGGEGDAGDGGLGLGDGGRADAGDGGGGAGDGGNGDGGTGLSDGGGNGGDGSANNGDGGPNGSEDSGPGTGPGNGIDGGDDGTSVGGGGFGCNVENAGGGGGGGAIFAAAGMILVGLRRRRRAR